MIQLTVALPLFNAQHIAFLAMESLCNQKGINFKWELVIAEENNIGRLGDRSILEYEERLKAVGCEKIEYLPILERWIPLGDKWLKIAAISSDTKGFLLQAADCYSQPYRLKETFDLFEQGADWVQSPLGIFYDIRMKKEILYDFSLNPHQHPCALNMAIRTNLIKKIKPAQKRAGVDYWLYNEGKKLKSDFKPMLNTSDNWKLGADTNGYNNISINRARNFKSEIPKNPFRATEIKIKDCLPEYIIKKLNVL
jgi:hypothetical protein